MFLVFRNNKEVKNITKLADYLVESGYGFSTYEKARQALRKYIRNAVKRGKFEDAKFGWMGAPRWDGISRNPVGYTNAGFTIRKVA